MYTNEYAKLCEDLLVINKLTERRNSRSTTLE